MRLEVINNGTEGLKPYTKYDSFTEFNIHVCGKPAPKQPKYYHAHTRMTFRNPNASYFYMFVLGKLIKTNEPLTVYQLGAKRHDARGNTHRHNTDILTAMKNAGMIEKVGKGRATKWQITKMGKDFYNDWR